MKKYTLAVVCILIALITGIGGMLYTYKPPVKISVIMSTYNRAPALPVAIESILKQTFNNFEFIIINDGSTDNSADVIKGYAQKDPRIVYLENKENKGLVYGLNRGLDIARGEYIARMDDDDESFPRRFEKQLKTLDSMPEITVLGTASTKSESIPDSPLLPTPIDPRKIDVYTYFTAGLIHPSIMMRRDFLEKNKIRYSEDYLYAEDMGLYKDILKHGGKLSMLPEPLLRYGIAKNRKKPEKYGQIQYDSSKKVQKEKLAPFGIYNSDDLNVNAPDEKCIYLRQLEKANKDKHILDQEVLEGVVNRQCPRNIRNAVIASRPGERQFWIERLGTREVSKFSDRFPGVVLKETDAKIMIQWKEWRCEVYRKTAKNEWLYESDCPKPKKGAAQ